MTWVDDMSMTPERIGERELVSGLSSDSSSWQEPGDTHLAEMFTIHASPRIPECPKAVANAAGEVQLSKCDVAELGIGIGRQIRIAIVTVIIFPRHRLGCDLRGISKIDKFACKT